MSRETKERTKGKPYSPASHIGSLVVPDFSNSPDRGEALYGHVLNAGTILRAALVLALQEQEVGTPGKWPDMVDLLEFLKEVLDAGTNEYDEQNVRNNRIVPMPTGETAMPGKGA